MNVAQDTKKKDGISLTMRLGLAVVLAVIVTVFFIIMYIQKIYLLINPFLFLFGMVPFFSYIFGLFINMIVQKYACDSIDIIKISTSNLFNFAIPLGALAITYFVPLINSPIESILPLTMDIYTKSQIATGFWLFWSILYSQTFASGFITVC